jgi:hypothetical protein
MLKMINIKSCKLQYRRGFLTLISTIMVAAIGLSITVSLLLLGLGTSRTSFAAEQSYQANGLASACAEEALQKIYESMAVTPPPPAVVYVGTGSLTLGQGTCIYTVSNSGLKITASGTVGTIIRKNELILSSVNPMTISSWQEVADFY